MDMTVEIEKEERELNPLCFLPYRPSDSGKEALSDVDDEITRFEPGLRVKQSGRQRTRAVDHSVPELKQTELQGLLTHFLPILQEYVVKHFRVSEDQAADWVQGFVLEKILEQDLIVQADHSRSRLRTFLLRCLDNYVIQQIRIQRARKRRPEAGLVCLEDLAEEDMPAELERAEESFDVVWARGILVECLKRMEAHCANTQREDIWGVFECRILKPLLEETEPLSYEELTKRFKLRSRSQASNLLITAQRIFARCLRSIIEECTVSQKEIESEIQELKSILFRASHRVVQNGCRIRKPSGE
jgi:DNA-directed RNA polymerase specialized sigma24 family protein